MTVCKTMPQARMAMDRTSLRMDRAPKFTALLVGRLYVRLDNAPAAASIYQDITARAADNLEALNGLGIARVMQRSLPEAEAAFRHAVAVAPDDQASRNNWHSP